MPHEVGPLISHLLRRVRDPHAIGTSRDLARKVLSYSQKVINAHGKYVVVEETLITKANQLIYPIAASLPLSTRIIAIFDADGTSIDYAKDWRNLANFKSSWFRDTSPSHHKTWSTIGRDLLILYPAKEVDSTVTVLSVKLTADLVDDDSEIELDQTNDRFLMDVGELILTIKNRNMPTANAMLKAIQQKVM